MLDVNETEGGERHHRRTKEMEAIIHQVNWSSFTSPAYQNKDGDKVQLLTAASQEISTKRKILCLKDNLMVYNISG